MRCVYVIHTHSELDPRVKILCVQCLDSSWCYGQIIPMEYHVLIIIVRLTIWCQYVMCGRVFLCWWCTILSASKEVIINATPKPYPNPTIHNSFTLRQKIYTITFPKCYFTILSLTSKIVQWHTYLHPKQGKMSLRKTAIKSQIRQQSYHLIGGITLVCVIAWHRTCIKPLLSQWASCQIRKFAGCACAGNAGNVFPATAGKRPWHASRHVRDARAVMHDGIAD